MKHPQTCHEPQLSRRNLLKGVGATLVLPWMESFAWAQSQPNLSPPRRYGVFLFANGVSEKDWWIKDSGNGLEFSRTLEPLAGFRNDLLAIDGLQLDSEFSTGVHYPYFSNFLSGAKLGDGTIPAASETVDHLIGRASGSNTFLPSLHLGSVAPRSGTSLGRPTIYNYTISWKSENVPIVPESSPRAAFDRLFDVTGRLGDRSVLDAVLDLSKDVNRKLNAFDRAKLDQYMTSIRELEGRIDRSLEAKRDGGWIPTLLEPDMPAPSRGAAMTLKEQMRLMLDINLLAFRMDKTRVSSFLFEPDGSASHILSFGFLDGVSNKGMHAISHHRKNPEVLSEYQKVNAYHVELFAEFLAKARAIQEGETTLLDNSMFLFGSNMRDGDKHNPYDLPLIIAGKGGGSISAGRHLNFADRPEEERLLCNLHLAMAQRMGCRVEQFGNSTMPLRELDG